MFTSEPAAWVMVLPSAIFESLPIIPATTARLAARLAAWRTPTPTKSPTCTKASCGSSG